MLVLNIWYTTSLQSWAFKENTLMIYIGGNLVTYISYWSKKCDFMIKMLAKLISKFNWHANNYVFSLFPVSK